MVWMTFLFPYYQTGKRCWLGLARRGFCVCPCVCVCPCLSLSLWDLPVWKRLRTVGLSSIFCSECLTTVLQLRGSISINQPWGLLRTNLGLSLPAEASKQILVVVLTQPKPSLDAGKHLSMYYGSTPLQESPWLSVFLSGGFPSCMPRETDGMCKEEPCHCHPAAPRTQS